MRPYVLLADDNADMREYATRLLSPQYEVKVVADGEAALQAMHERRPDLLLSDVMMPRLDGFGLLAAMRADPALRDLPVILLSARAGDEARVEGLDAGADDYLVKPFAARELLARVRSNLDLARMRREAAEQIREEARRLELLNHAGNAIAAELDLERVVQTVTDAAVELTGAEFGAFFYNVPNDAGESYTLYTLSGAPREAFAGFPMPRNTKVFDPTFRGEGIVRSDDITRDPRYGQNPPYHGKPQGASAGAQLSRGAGRVALRRSHRRAVLRAFRARRVQRARRADRRRHRGAGGNRDRQCAALPRQPPGGGKPA